MSYWSQPLRVETPDYPVLITSRTINSVLWFVNSKQLELFILGYLAKYQQKYNVEIFSFVLMGNHFHLLARFPEANMASFMRDLNARIAGGVSHLVPQFPGGPLFQRRYSSQILPLEDDAEHYFFYCALQAVNDGLASRISEYPGYNSVYDAMKGRVRKYKTVHWGKYAARRRTDPNVSIEEFTEWNELRFSRLPSFEALEQKDYEKQILRSLEQKRIEKVKDWLSKKHRFPSKDALRRMKPGSLPRKTKKGIMRPIVLSQCQKTRKRFLSWYFSIVESYREASERFRNGDLTIQFPPMTYRPLPGLCLSLSP